MMDALKRPNLDLTNIMRQTNEIIAQNDKILEQLVNVMDMACKKKRKGKGK